MSLLKDFVVLSAFKLTTVIKRFNKERSSISHYFPFDNTLQLALFAITSVRSFIILCVRPKGAHLSMISLSQLNK